MAIFRQPWRRNRENLRTLFAYPQDICKVIYPINAIESLNSVIRHAIKKRKIFLIDNLVKKSSIFPYNELKKRTMPIQNRKSAMSRFIILLVTKSTVTFNG